MLAELVRWKASLLDPLNDQASRKSAGRERNVAGGKRFLFDEGDGAGQLVRLEIVRRQWIAAVDPDEFVAVCSQPSREQSIANTAGRIVRTAEGDDSPPGLREVGYRLPGFRRKLLRKRDEQRG